MAGMNRNAGPVKRSKNAGKTMKRLLAYIVKEYKIECAVVLVCILISSLASVIGTVFLKNLIDNYITPLLGKDAPDFTPLLKALGFMAIV